LKAAECLRHMDYYCKRLTVDVKLAGHRGYWARETDFAETQDSQFLLGLLYKLWREYEGWKPLRVGVTLHGLVPAASHQFDLFEKPRPIKLFDAVDSLNGKFGRHTVCFGLNPYVQEKMGRDKIAFSRVPEREYL